MIHFTILHSSTDGAINFPMVQAMMDRAAYHNPYDVEIVTDKAERSNFQHYQMYQMRITYCDAHGTRADHGITIGCVQRTAGGEFEFHS